MDGACSTYKGYIRIRFWAKNVKGIFLLEDLGLDGRIIKLALKLIRSDLGWIYLANSRLLPKIKLLVLQNAENFLTRLIAFSFSRHFNVGWVHPVAW
jgi:hypothetical protein